MLKRGFGLLTSARPAVARGSGIGLRRSSTFQQDASHALQAAMSAVSPESPVYNESEVRQWLSGFEGGSVDLEMDHKSKIATVTLSNPGKKNALTGRMMVQLADVVNELFEYKEGEGVIMRGKDGEFCSGGDLSFMRQIADHRSGAKMSIFMQTLVAKWHRLPMLTVALVEQFALGGGAELCVACNFRLLSPEARIGFVQPRLGVSTGWGGGTHLTRVLGAREALKLLASGKILTAQEAKELQLADAIVAERGGPEETLAFAKEWLRHNYLQGYACSVRAAKRVVQNASEVSFSEAMNRERDVFARLWGGPSHLEALEKMGIK